MENRFLASGPSRGNGTLLVRPRPSTATSFGWSAPFSATDRALVVLIENGGVDLGIPALVDKLLDLLPGSSLLPSGVRASMITWIQNQIRDLTDNLLESADLALNGFSQAKPSLYGDVTVLRDSTASYNDLKSSLLAFTSAGKSIDVFILTHGGTDRICLTGDISGQMIRDMRTANGGAPLRIRSVYMMNCVGSSLNQAWIDAGAKVSAGSIRNNYLPEPTMHHFWTNWKAGQGFEAAVSAAYRQTIREINTIINAFIASLGPVVSAAVGTIDVSSMDFVTDSAPVVTGDGTVTISSDSLSFTTSLVPTTLSTTVLPAPVLKALSEGAPVTAREKHLSVTGRQFVEQWESTPGAALVRDAGQTLGAWVAKAEAALNANVPSTLTQDQFDALVSFVLGIGGRRFQSSRVFQLLKDGPLSAVPTEMRKWAKVSEGAGDDPVLARRRDAEARLFDGASAAATSQSLPVRGLARPFGAVNYSIPGMFAPIQQPSPMTCWAAVMTMMMCWKTQSSMTIPTALGRIGPSYVDKFNRGEGLDSTTAGGLYADAGLVPLISQNPTIDGWQNLLQQYGPLYVDVGYDNTNTTHAIIVTGIAGDGTADGTTITYVDPWTGTVIHRKFADFLHEYETPGAVNWPYVIVHWPAGASTASSLPMTGKYTYSAPSSFEIAQSQVAYAQNPAAIIAGIEVADAIQIGLGAVSIIQAQVGASQGSFTLVYPQVQRLLTAEARTQMPGAQQGKQSYRRRLFHIGSENALITFAQAEVIIEWEGNPYGEIGTPVIRRDLQNSTEWSKSSCNLQISKIDRIPPPGADPRTWPIVYTYEGTYDPPGNGYWEFSGEFEVNAFGGLKFNRHEVVSRSLIDATLDSPESFVQKGADAIVPVPTIPDDQLAYLRAHPAQ